MARIQLVTLLLILTPLLNVGCSGVKPNTPLSTYERQSTTVPALMTVSTPGNYALFPGIGIQPIATVPLKGGDKFGFVSQEGAVSGVYTSGGATRYIPLNGVLAAEYVWKLQAEK